MGFDDDSVRSMLCVACEERKKGYRAASKTKREEKKKEDKKPERKNERPKTTLRAIGG